MIQKIKRLFYVFITFNVYAFNFLIGRKVSGQQWLFDRLSHLGGIYIKFLQLAALSKNIAGINITSLKDVLAVYDQVSFEEIDIKKLMTQELGLKKDQIIFDSDKPFAAGSFAQVYSGTLNN